MTPEGATYEDYLAARALCSQIGPLIGVSEREVFNALLYMPDEVLSHLRTPSGWTALAGSIANDLGTEPPIFQPMVH